MVESSCVASLDLTWLPIEELWVVGESRQSDNLDEAEDIETINTLTNIKPIGENKLPVKNIVQDIRESLPIIVFIISLLLILKLMAIILPDDIAKIIGYFIRAPFNNG